MNKTLLSINNYYYMRGGAEAVFLRHNALFKDAGWDIIPFAMQHEKNLASEWDPYFIQEIEFGNDYSLMEKIARAPKVIYSLEARRNMGRLIRDQRPAIAHAHNVYHHISPSIFSVLRKAGIPLLLTLHDLKIACPAYQMLASDGVCERCKHGNISNVIRHRCIKNSLALSTLIFFETWVHRLLGCYGRNVSRFIVPSRFYREKLVEWGLDREKIVYIPNFADISSFSPSSSIGRRFVYFGRLAPEKGLRTLIEAAALAGVGVVIIGSGPEEEALRRLAEARGADVTFSGYQKGTALHDLIHDSRAVILASEWYENAPMSILEAYALTRPVIGADIGGIPELIRPGETGAIFTAGDAHALAGVLSGFSRMSDADILAMGQAGRKWVEEEFSSSRYLARMSSLYKQLLCS